MDTTKEENATEEKILCADCGCEIDAEFVNAWQNCDGDPVCCACGDDYAECADCGDIVRVDDTHENADGYPICEDCNDNYFTCEDCNRIIHSDDINRTANENYVCESCLDRNYTRCDDCGEYFIYGEIWNINNDNDRVCHDCYDRGDYFTCDCCGESFSSDRYHGDGWCDSCVEDREDDSVIHDYNYKPTWEYHALPGESGNGCFLGVELEVENKGRRYDNEEVAEETIGYAPCVCKHDSSINYGFEIVFHPQTFGYATTGEGKEAIENVLQNLRHSRFAGHNYGGIHVHISRSAFSRLHLYKFHKLFLHASELLTAISQRKQENLDQWGGFGKLYADGVGSIGRYSALNYTRQTVEVRIFNSTIRTDRFFKNLECVQACIDFSKKHGIREMQSANFLRFIFTNRHKYKNLVNFLVERSRGMLQAANVDAKIMTQIDKRLSRLQTV